MKMIMNTETAVTVTTNKILAELNNVIIKFSFVKLLKINFAG